MNKLRVGQIFGDFIIFVTNMAQYAVKGYEVNALYYIIKPINYQNVSFKLRTGDRVALILFAGDARIDNRKFKDCFHAKPRMLAAADAERLDFGGEQFDKLEFDELIRKEHTNEKTYFKAIKNYPNFNDS